MRALPLDHEFLWQCLVNVQRYPCGLCGKPTKTGCESVACILCCDETGGVFHDACLRRAGEHLCPTHWDAPLSAIERASDEVAATRWVERFRFENDRAADWLRRGGRAA